MLFDLDCMPFARYMFHVWGCGLFGLGFGFGVSVAPLVVVALAEGWQGPLGGWRSYYVGVGLLLVKVRVLDVARPRPLHPWVAQVRAFGQLLAFIALVPRPSGWNCPGVASSLPT